MKKIIGLFVMILAAILLIISVAGCQQKIQTAPSPSPTAHPSPAPRLAKYIRMEAVFDKDDYPPKEEISIELSFTNITSEPYEISPFPPLVEVRADGKRDNVVRTFAAGSGNITVQPEETTEHTLVWDQQDEQGQQVTYGYYDFYVPDGGTLEDKAIVGGIHVLPPEGIIEKPINVGKSQTVNGITVTLNRVELTASGPRFYAFSADFGQLTTPDEMPPAPYAEYYLDNGTVREEDKVNIIGGGSNLEGQEYVWMMSMPVPKGTKELTFIITEFGGQEGLWEFKIPLD